LLINKQSEVHVLVPSHLLLILIPMPRLTRWHLNRILIIVTVPCQLEFSCVAVVVHIVLRNHLRGFVPFGGLIFGGGLGLGDHRDVGLPRFGNAAGLGRIGELLGQVVS
jgi:hypothetical protein